MKPLKILDLVSKLNGQWLWLSWQSGTVCLASLDSTPQVSPVVVGEQFLQTPKARGSNPVIGKFYFLRSVNYIEKTKIMEKEAENGPLNGNQTKSKLLVKYFTPLVCL